MTAIEAKFGSAPITVMIDPRFAGDALEWRDEIASSKPREADNRMVVFGRLLSWAKKRQRISTNVLEGYERIIAATDPKRFGCPNTLPPCNR